MSFTKSTIILIFMLILSSFTSFSNGFPREICRFDQIYQLGDFSNNFIKDIGLSMSIPSITPYKNNNTDGGDFRYGINFAESRSTVLSSEVLASQNIFPPVNTSSLQLQLEWMNSYFESFCLENRDCGVKLQNALFMVGEIDGNDYYYGMFQGNKSMDEVRNVLVPQVVDNIIQAVKKVISYGATRVMVPGNLQIGCLPIYKTVAFNYLNNTNISASAYDDNHCLREFNELATYHNEKLQQALDSLRNDEAIIMYVDYYSAYQHLIEYANFHGMETQKACCGIGGDLNFNISRMCGSDPDVPVCPHPNGHLIWDGIQLTTHGYELLADWLMNNHILRDIGLWCFYN